MNPVKVGLLGLGTVGGGTATVLKRNAEEIARRAGRGIIVDYAATLDVTRADELGMPDLRITQDAFDVVNDPDISIVVELIGGYSPAKELVLQAIENGKHVVTANKALIAVHGNEIF
ncbi:MAG: homoserine dehydrogenase, partial [Cocleimonas sp.]|nr:homoserine dehydrogenase [Cocleimonas sp.]